MRFQFLVLSLVAALGAATSAPAQPPPANNVPIRVYWTNSEPPKRVVFEDPRTGVLPFTPKPNHFEGRRGGRGRWVTHEVMIFYRDGELPLAIRTAHNQPPLRLDLYRPSVARCRQSEVNAIVADRPRQATVGLRRIMAVRQLLVTDTSCPAGAKRVLSKYYFEASCALAMRVPYLLVPQEAKDLYIATARTVREESRIHEAVTTCDTTLSDMVDQ
jgi:hypothetical protein